jgi:hypothetical protein
MSDREFGGNDDLSLPKGMQRARPPEHFQAANREQPLYKRLFKTFWPRSRA